MRKAENRLGIKLGKPKYVPLRNNRAEDYIEGLKQVNPKEVKIVIVLIFND